MQRHESSVTNPPQPRDYSAQFILVDEPGQWSPGSLSDYLYKPEFSDFRHDPPVTKSDIDTASQYGDLIHRINSLESTITGQRDLLLQCLSRLTHLTDMLGVSQSVCSTSITSITVDDAEVPLRIPIAAIIEEDEDEVGARVPEFSASGFGATEAEAVAELKCELGSLYADLINTPMDILGVLPKRWKQGLSNLVVPNGK